MAENNYTRNDLLALIKDIFQVEDIPPMITRQIVKYITEYDMNFKDIARGIVYATEVKHLKMEPQYGIAIVLTLREETARYFKQLELDKQRQEAEGKKAVEYQGNNIKFTIKNVKKKRKIKQLDMNEIVLTEEEDDK